MARRGDTAVLVMSVTKLPVALALQTQRSSLAFGLLTEQTAQEGLNLAGNLLVVYEHYPKSNVSQ